MRPRLVRTDVQDSLCLCAMRRLLSLIAWGLAGCASVQPPAPSTPGAARRAFDGRTAEVVLADGSTWRAAALRIEAEETSWRAGGETVRVPTCAVAEVRARPAAWRLPVGRVLAAGGAGLVAGAVGGAVCGAGGDADATCVAGLALGTAAAGVLLGLGAALASRPPPPPRPVHLAPTCDAAPVRSAPGDGG